MKRYWIIGFDVEMKGRTLSGKERVKEHINGDWVKWEDVKRLAEENKRLRRVVYDLVLEAKTDGHHIKQTRHDEIKGIYEAIAKAYELNQ